MTASTPGSAWRAVVAATFLSLLAPAAFAEDAAKPDSAATPAATPAKPDFAAWLEALKTEARGHGIADATLAAAFEGVQPIDRIIELDHRQAEFTLTFQQYLDRVVTEKRVAEGRALLAKHRRVLGEIARRYGVPAKYIVAMWGIESDYGRAIGDYPEVTALATLAYDGRRSQFFRGELMNALTIIDHGGPRPSEMKGSWAGAMGQCQFMPSTYLKYAQHWPGASADADIWSRPADVFASTANYLSNIGWNADVTWGRAVRLPDGLDPALVNLNVRKSLREWARLGVLTADGHHLPKSDIPASLVRADSGKGDDAGKGPPYLVYDNFRVLMQWNRSVFFALTAGTLADRLGSR